MADNIPDYVPILSHGGHSSPEQGACVMEMVSFITGEKWTDHPRTVHATLAEVARNTNDFVSDDNRSRIADMIPRFIGTNGIPDEKYREVMQTKLKAHPELIPFIGSSVRPGSILANIRKHFEEEPDIDKRFTNEEYDHFAMTILEVALDAADEILERGNYEVSKEEAWSKVSELPGQVARINAR